jgi:hypothetical protein
MCNSCAFFVNNSIIIRTKLLKRAHGLLLIGKEGFGLFLKKTHSLDMQAQHDHTGGHGRRRQEPYLLLFFLHFFILLLVVDKIFNFSLIVQGISDDAYHAQDTFTFKSAGAVV